MWTSILRLTALTAIGIGCTIAKPARQNDSPICPIHADKLALCTGLVKSMSFSTSGELLTNLKLDPGINGTETVCYRGVLAPGELVQSTYSLLAALLSGQEITLEAARVPNACVAILAVAPPCRKPGASYACILSARNYAIDALPKPPSETGPETPPAGTCAASSTVANEMVCTSVTIDSLKIGHNRLLMLSVGPVDHPQRFDLDWGIAEKQKKKDKGKLESYYKAKAAIADAAATFHHTVTIDGYRGKNGATVCHARKQDRYYCLNVIGTP